MATIQADKINGVLKANTSEVNGVALSSMSLLVGVGRSLLSTTYDFNNQSIVTSATQNGWSPSSGHSSWINGAAAVKNYKNGGKWSSSSQTPINGEPSFAGAANITGWKVDSNATGSAYTGPSGAHNGSGGHSTLYNTRYVYTEVSSSRHSYHHIMRTPAINFSTAMGDTGNNLNLEFYIHGWGSNIGVLTVWIDDAATSNSSDATILGQFSGTHSGSFISGTSTLSSQGTNNTTVKLGGTQNGSATFTGTSSNWAKAELRLNNYRTVNTDHYIYFVYVGDTSYRGDLAVDDVSFIESE